jgi:ABC-type branched-subunit amino acid transport system ATPase component/ABC-type branched-subunit amino acid transport system permease subunit
LVPDLVGTRIPFFISGLCTAVMLLSLGLLVRVSGQVSLCHAAFAAIGAVAFSQLRVDHGVPWLLALVLAGLVVVPVGAIVAIPTIRLSGLFLALATLGFGILVQRLLYVQNWMFSSVNTGRVVPRPDFARGQQAWYYFVLAIFVVTSLAITVIQRSRLGRMLNGMAEAPTAVAALGLTTSVSRVLVFCVSAFFAGIAGVLYAATFGYAVSADKFYIPFTSLILLAMLALAPFAEPWYALVPAIGIVIPGYISGRHTSEWLNVLFGVLAVLVAMKGSHPPMPDRLRRILDRLAPPRRNARTAPSAVASSSAAGLDEGDGSGLILRGLSVRFGGLIAVDDASLSAPLGQITGLIGPNGAGKTTTFDACSGLNRRYQGHVALNGRDLSGCSPSVRGRAGLGRTFQRMQLGDSLTVHQNVMLGSEASAAGGNPLHQLAAAPSTLDMTRQRTAAAMELCGITELAERQVGALSTGERRLVELARCLSGQFKVLLLDEPSSGLDTAESTRFGQVLRQVVTERGIGILLVEHDMRLVMAICKYIYVLDFGRLIFEGDPAAVAASAVVRTAYLGGDPLIEAETL